MTDPLVADSAAQALVDALREGGQTVATAESPDRRSAVRHDRRRARCEHGPAGGVVVYATDLKSTLGGVDPDALATDGPVAARTARALALAVARNADADWGVSLTGVAGPDPQDGHAPGTVFCGIARRRSLADETVAQAWQLSGTRWEIRLTSARRALQELLTMVHADRVTKEA